MIIDGMNNKKETDHIRSNYRLRLEDIRKLINEECEVFDREMARISPMNDTHMKKDFRI